MKRRIAGILLGATVLFALGLFVLMAWAAVSVQPLAISRDATFMAWSPLLEWSWSGEGDAFKCLLVTDLKARKTVALDVPYSFTRWRRTREAWSEGDRPSLAVTHFGPTRNEWGERLATSPPSTLTVYSTRTGLRREFVIPDDDTYGPRWGPDGRYLLLTGERSDPKGLAPRRVLLWREGLEAPAPLVPPAGVQWFQSFSPLKDDQALICMTDKGGTGRFFLIDVKDTAAMKDVTGCFPAVSGKIEVSHRAANPDAFLIVARPKEAAKAVAILTRYPSPDVVRSWEGVSWAWIGREGRSIGLTYQDERNGEVTRSESVRVSLADFSGTSLFRVEGDDARGGLITHPEGSWYGFSGFTSEKTLLGRSWSCVLRDEKCFKSAPLQHKGTLGWTGGAGHWRFAVVGKGPLFPHVVLLDPLNGSLERVPSPHAWGALLAPAMRGYWVSFLGFLLNALLFVVLFYGRSASEGARPLGFFFWSMALLCLVFDGDGISAVTGDTYGYEPFGLPFRLFMVAGQLLIPFALGALPCAALLFATEFPAPNAYRTKYPRLVGVFRALTFTMPFLFLGGVFLEMLQHVLSALGNARQPDTAEKALRGLEAASSFLIPVIVSFVVWAVLILILTAAAVVHNFRFAPSPRVRGQLLFVALGLGLFVAWAAVGAFINSLIYLSHPGFTAVFIAILVFIPALFCGYALLSKELLDISFVIRRTVKYAVLIAILGLLFVGIVAGLGVLLPSVLGAQSPVSVALASVVTVLAFQPARRRVQDWVDKRFDRARYDARRTLSDLTARFATMGSTEQIRATLESAARDVLRVGECRTLFFREGKIPRGQTGVSALQENVDGGARPGQPADLKDVDLKDLRDALAVEEPWIKLVVPVARGNEAYAVLALGEKLSQEKYSAEDREFLKILTDGAGLALKNLNLVKEAARAEVFEKDLEAAATVQSRHLPKRLPVIPGYEVAASTQPARIVGGDYYDVIPLPDGRFALVVADVSGKGMPAALRMADLRSHLKALLPRVEDPGRVLSEVNRYLCEEGSPNEFTTLFLGVLDPSANALACSSAGHIPPLARDAGGRTGPILSGGSFPLGIDPTEGYASSAFALEPGSLLICISDGLPERKDPEGNLLGFEAVEGAVAGAPLEASPHDTITALNALADEFARGELPEDDTTIVVLRRAP